MYTRESQAVLVHRVRAAARSAQKVPAVLWLCLLLAVCGWSQPTPAGSGRDAGSSQALQDAATPGMAGDPAEDAAPRGPVADQIRSGKYALDRIGRRGVGAGVNLYSVEHEQQMGREYAMQVEHASRVLRDPVVSTYVNRVAQNIVRHSDAQVPFTIRVLENDEVNAFALPGGFLYVNTGLILASENEAELAAVIAHEVAHVAARHATRNETKRQIWNMASIPLMMVGGPAGLALQQVASVAGPMSFMKFSRDAEREADLLGMEYEYAAGYDPRSFVDFFERLAAEDRRQKHGKASTMLVKTFSTHPMNSDRAKRAEMLLSALPSRDDYVVSTSDFDEARSQLMAVLRLHQADASAGPVLHDRTNKGETAGNDGPQDDRPVLHRR